MHTKSGQVHIVYVYHSQNDWGILGKGYKGISVLFLCLFIRLKLFQNKKLKIFWRIFDLSIMFNEKVFRTYCICSLTLIFVEESEWVIYVHTRT